MNKNIERRVLKESNYIVDNKTTIREVARVFNSSKSTVGKDLKDRLPLLDNDLSMKVNRVLEKNFFLKHLRGGKTTKEKYSLK